MSFRRSLFAAAATLVIATPAAAHDFWLMPQAFQIEEPDQTQIRFMVGHADEVSGWSLQWDRVVALRLHGGGEVTDLQPGLVTANGAVPGFAPAMMDRPGTYVAAFESHHSFSELEAEKFEDYARDEGLMSILSHRERTRTEDQPGIELYSRRAKTLLQLGDKPTDEVLQPLGHTLEIVPERHPYALGEDRSLPVRVLFRGAPLEGATIDLTALDTGEDPREAQVTDADGRAAFTVPEEGAWKLNVIWGEPIPTGRADYETVFSSLTFGYGE